MAPRSSQKRATASRHFCCFAAGVGQPRRRRARGQSTPTGATARPCRVAPKEDTMSRQGSVRGATMRSAAVVVLLVGAAAAWAQPTPESRAKARSYFDAGVEAYDQ